MRRTQTLLTLLTVVVISMAKPGDCPGPPTIFAHYSPPTYIFLRTVTVCSAPTFLLRAW